MIEINLEQPIKVFKDGAYVETDAIQIEYKGRKGFGLLSKIQDTVTASLMGMGKGGAGTEERESKGVDLTLDELAEMIDLTGATANINDVIIDSLKVAGSVGGVKLTDKTLDELSLGDYEKIVKSVLKEYILGKIIHKLNSIK